ncbi:MAG: DUF481 domain-containing protein [Acidobacteriota bacterium]|nr:DUF481 domain-containing protein [Acidobacteriota bacterium]
MKLNCLCLLLINCAGSGLLLADQITLKNGDVITGTIIKKDGGKLTMKSEFLGEVTMPWEAITALRSDAPVTVVLPGGHDVSGKVTTQGNQIQIDGGGVPQTASLAEVSGIRDTAEQRKYERLVAPGWLDLWAGSFDLGFALARGNARTRILTTAFSAARVTRKDKTTVRFAQIDSSATLNGRNSATANAARGGIAYEHKLKPRLFLTAFNDYEYDQFQNLDLRFVAGGGLGFHLLKRERASLDVSGGGDYSRETFGTGLSRSSAEAYWGDEVTYKFSRATAITQSFRMFNNLTRTGEYRVNFDASAVTTLRKWLSWQMTASDRYLSAPVIGHERNDILLSTGLRATFARE